MIPMTLLWFACVVACALGKPMSIDEQINYINNLPGMTWKAGRNLCFNTTEQMKKRLGVDREANREYNKRHLAYPELVFPLGRLPTDFDARLKWNNCSTLRTIRDQSNCGSCWAFSSAEAMSDRVCIFNKTNVYLSADDINSCCTTCGRGCGGGYPLKAYEYWIKHGVVTGGPYGSQQGCMPYEIAPGDPYPGPTPKCKHRCISGYPKTYRQDKHFGGNSYGVKGVQTIMREIFYNGPVTATYTVYADFMNYKSGVYKHVYGKDIGEHAVKILGWGVDGGQDYWLVANSWGTSFGLKGYFKIAKGSDECGIEAQIVAGTPGRRMP